MEAHYLPIILLLLASALIIVSIAIRFGLGPILGYMVAGLIVGPSGFGILEQSEIIEALAELGVVFLLFAIGLDLPIARLRSIGSKVIFVGFLQVTITMVVAAYLAWLVTGSGAAAIAAGAALALSSTAIVARLLTDLRMHNSRTGRTAIAILLIQDLAFGPLLVLVLALGDRAETDLTQAMVITLIKGTAALAVIWFVGRLVIVRLFTALAAIKVPDLFSGLTLLTLFGISFVTHAAGLSMGFGGFMAGMLLADTQFRHQVAADIRPFRGLLLGLFFITIGMRIDLAPLLNDALMIFGVVTLILTIKTLIITLLTRAAGLEWHRALHSGLLLAQGGEFAFVILAGAMSTRLVEPYFGQILMLATIITMALTPLLAWAGGRIERAMPDPEESVTPLADLSSASEHDLSDHVVIAGFGRVGRQIARQLTESHINWVAVDTSIPAVRAARQRNEPVHFADITHPEVLEALHIGKARGLIVAFNDADQAIILASLVHYIFPNLKITARAFDEEQAELIRQAGAITAVPEVLDTGRYLLEPILESR